MSPTPQETLAAIERLFRDQPELAARQRDMVLLQERARSVADIVQAYRVGNMPNNAPAIQVRETEQAIFAACHMLLAVFLRQAKSPDTGAVERWVGDILHECEAYALRRAPQLLNQ